VRFWLAFMASLVLISPLIGSVLLWSIKILVDDVLVAGRIDLLPIFAAGYLIIAAVKVAVDYGSTRLDAAIVERLVQNIRADLYRHLVSISPGALAERSIGDLLAHLSSDVERVETLIFTGPLRLVADVAAALWFGFFLFVISWKLTLVALLVAPLLAFVSLYYSPRVRRAARIARQQTSAWLARAEERLGAAPIIHAFAAQAHEASAFLARCAATRRAELRTVAIQAWTTLLIEAAATLAGLAVLGAGAYEINSGALTVGSLVAFLGSVGALYDPIRGLARAAGRFQRAAAGGHRVAALLDMRGAVEECSTAQPLVGVQGAIEFRDVSFGYAGHDKALDRVSFRIEPGEIVAVAGPSGSGKSTLVRLLLRFYDPDSGAVLIDGRDIRDVTLESLRRAVSVVFQDPYIFRGSIAENIRYGRLDAAEENIIGAAVAAYVDPFTRAVPAGYAAAVGPRGARLSGGQRQRIALARALVCDAPILVLDEATASVDSETEELIQQAVDRLVSRRTILLIGHRLSTLRRADRIIVLDRGRIAESGTPAALLRAGTRYRDLFAAQIEIGSTPA
jgi:ABC-type multidrug transport system fused ATPase/permease subunit